MENKKSSKISFVIMRVMLSLIFIVAAFNHLLHPHKVAGRLQKSDYAAVLNSVADPVTLVTLAGFGLLTGGLLLLIGYKTRWAALLLILILIPITLTIQLNNPEGAGPLFKNIAILGTLIFFALNGAVFYGIDQLRVNHQNNQKHE